MCGRSPSRNTLPHRFREAYARFSPGMEFLGKESAIWLEVKMNHRPVRPWSPCKHGSEESGVQASFHEHFPGPDCRVASIRLCVDMFGLTRSSGSARRTSSPSRIPPASVLNCSIRMWYQRDPFLRVGQLCQPKTIESCQDVARSQGFAAGGQHPPLDSPFLSRHRLPHAGTA